MARLNNHIEDLQHRGSLSPCGVSGWARTGRMHADSLISIKSYSKAYRGFICLAAYDGSGGFELMVAACRLGMRPISVDYICGWIRSHLLQSATLRRLLLAAESAVAQIPDLAQLEKINPRSIRHIRVFSRYAPGMREIRDAIYQ